MIRSLIERFEFARFCVVHMRPPAAQKRWQEKHMRSLLRHAYAHVPLWRDLLDERSIDVEDIRTLEDLRRIPQTTKELFLGRPFEEYIDGSRPIQAFWYVTSGTSGSPLRFMLGERAVIDRYIDFASMRFLWWLGRSIHGLATTNLARIKIRSVSSKHRLFVPVEDYLIDPRRALQALVDFSPEVISAYPSTFLDMAQRLSRDPSLPRPQFRYALSFGETLFPATRRFIESALGCEVYNRYGLEEIGVVGLECRMHDGFHIHTESVIVEVVDANGEAVEEGTEGRLLMTDLFNFGMPFIRYDVGDIGHISYEPCACGLVAPRIWIKGRYSAYLSFPHRRVHHLEFDGAMDGFMNAVRRFQIAKQSDTRIIARVIPGPSYHVSIEERIRQNLMRLVGGSVEIDVEIVEELPPSPRGKSRIVIDESLSVDNA